MNRVKAYHAPRCADCAFPMGRICDAGALISGNPIPLANALRKLERASDTSALDHASPATADLFIVNPFSVRA